MRCSTEAFDHILIQLESFVFSLYQIRWLEIRVVILFYGANNFDYAKACRKRVVHGFSEAAALLMRAQSVTCAVCVSRRKV